MLTVIKTAASINYTVGVGGGGVGFSGGFILFCFMRSLTEVDFVSQISIWIKKKKICQIIQIWTYQFVHAAYIHILTAG